MEPLADDRRVTSTESWRKAYEAAPKRGVDFETMSGIPLDPGVRGGLAGAVAVYAWSVCVHVSDEVVDDADVRGLRDA